MNTGERLAAHLSGDLDPDERTALEADLAGDPALRAQLERIRRSDERLAALEDPALPDGFGDRLRERLRPELDAVLGDELAARRARRGTPRWLPAVGAAAAIAVVVAGGIAVVQPGGGDDAAESAAGTDQRVTSDAGDTDEAADGAFDTMMTPEAGPRIVARGRTITAEDLEALGQDPDVQAGLTADAVQTDPQGAAGAWAAGLGGDADLLADQEAATEAEGDGGAGEDAAAPAEESETVESGATLRGSAPAIVSGEVTDADREAVSRCLSVLYEAAAAPVVPLYAELAEDADGNPVVVYVALAPDADGAYERLEVWMVDRETCEPRLFVQGEAQPVERNAP